jgi:hypothetical protein
MISACSCNVMDYGVLWDGMGWDGIVGFHALRVMSHDDDVCGDGDVGFDVEVRIDTDTDAVTLWI